MSNTQSKVANLAKAGVVAGLYVAITLLLAPFSFGAVQLRLSELFNNLSVFNKRYIWAAIANLTSPLGVVDVIFGSLGTLVMTSLSYYLTRNVESVPKKLAICVIICALMSWSVALELYFVSKAPFWMTYLTVGIGELISMAIGAIIVYGISKVVDLSE